MKEVKSVRVFTTLPQENLTKVGPAAQAAGCELQEKRATSREHTTSLDQAVKYNTNPPTTGRHYQIPAQDGIYGQAPRDEELVHTMEHGRVIIWVKPSVRDCTSTAPRLGSTNWGSRES